MPQIDLGPINVLFTNYFFYISIVHWLEMVYHLLNLCAKLKSVLNPARQSLAQWINWQSSYNKLVSCKVTLSEKARLYNHNAHREKN